MMSNWAYCTAMLWFLAGGAAAAPAESQPNFVIILIDDMGWTDLACYGSKTYETPGVDRLAAEGMRFTQGYSACTVCSPTRSAVMTGKYPARLHITDWIAGHDRPFAKLKIPDWTKYLPLEEITIAEALKPVGYATACIGKWHLGGGSFMPDHQGFDVAIANEAGSPPSYFSPYKIPGIPDGPKGEYLGDREADEAVRFIEAHRDRPFLLYLPHHIVHTPLQAKADVIAKYEKKIVPGSTHSNSIYAAMVESVSDSVGRVLDALAKSGLDQKTVVFFTSDNGGLSGHTRNGNASNGPTSNIPLRAGKGSTYEGGVRVPLIVKWPGKTKPGSVCKAPVISCDIYPTILSIAGITPKDGQLIDGESIVPLLQESGSLKRDSIYWHYPHYHPGGATPYSAIRKGDWKLIEFFEDGRRELYNVQDDIGETSDLAAANPDKARDLYDQLAGWRRDVGAQLPTANPNHDPAKAHLGASKKK